MKKQDRQKRSIQGTRKIGNKNILTETSTNTNMDIIHKHLQIHTLGQRESSVKKQNVKLNKK
jgi:hypothetical protein